MPKGKRPSIKEVLESNKRAVDKWPEWLRRLFENA